MKPMQSSFEFTTSCLLKAISSEINGGESSVRGLLLLTFDLVSHTMFLLIYNIEKVPLLRFLGIYAIGLQHILTGHGGSCRPKNLGRLVEKGLKVRKILTAVVMMEQSLFYLPNEHVLLERKQPGVSEFFGLKYLQVLYPVKRNCESCNPEYLEHTILSIPAFWGEKCSQLCKTRPAAAQWIAIKFTNRKDRIEDKWIEKESRQIKTRTKCKTIKRAQPYLNMELTIKIFILKLVLLLLAILWSIANYISYRFIHFYLKISPSKFVQTLSLLVIASKMLPLKAALQGFDSHRDPPVCVTRGGHGPVGPAADEALVRKLVGRDDGEGVADVARRATGTVPALGASVVRPHAAGRGHQTKASSLKRALPREGVQAMGPKQRPAWRTGGDLSFPATPDNLSQEIFRDSLPNRFSRITSCSLTGSSSAAPPNRPELQSTYFYQPLIISFPTRPFLAISSSPESGKLFKDLLSRSAFLSQNFPPAHLSTGFLPLPRPEQDGVAFEGAEKNLGAPRASVTIQGFEGSEAELGRRSKTRRTRNAEDARVNGALKSSRSSLLAGMDTPPQGGRGGRRCLGCVRKTTDSLQYSGRAQAHRLQTLANARLLIVAEVWQTTVTQCCNLMKENSSTLKIQAKLIHSDKTLCLMSEVLACEQQISIKVLILCSNSAKESLSKASIKVSIKYLLIWFTDAEQPPAIQHRIGDSALHCISSSLTFKMQIFPFNAKGQVDIELEIENYVTEVHSEIHCSGSVLKRIAPLIQQHLDCGLAPWSNGFLKPEPATKRYILINRNLPEKKPSQLAMLIKMKSLNSPLHRHRRLMVYEALAKSGLNVLMSKRIGSFYEERNIMSSFFRTLQEHKSSRNWRKQQRQAEKEQGKNEMSTVYRMDLAE
ncbi:hypothetical protein E2320_011558 [Naja naja]|nr:hypothetical protein E2320_011558 [Naja naja]